MHLRSKGNKDRLLFNPEIEAFARRNSAQTSQSRQGTPEGTPSSLHISSFRPEPIPMAGVEEEQPINNNPPPVVTLEDYAAPQGPRNSSPFVLSPEAMAMEIKPGHYNLIVTNQFTGKDHEDPHAHLETFYDLVATMGIDPARVEDAYKRLFHLTILGDAKEWFKTLPSQSLRTWAEAEKAFLVRFYPPAKVVNARTEISTFKQGNDESFHEAWERFRRLLRKCPNHGLPDVAQLNIFCTGLRHDWKIHLDATAGGSIMKADVNTALTIINNMANNDRAEQ